MNDTLKFILEKWNIDMGSYKDMPIEIPDAGRNDLAKLFGELGFRLGAEIGVLNGLYSEQLCVHNHGLKLYCVDPWFGYPGYENPPMRNKPTWNNVYAEAKGRLKGYDVVFVRKPSMKAVHGFAHNSLDFVYIDANHELPYVMDDILHWADRVKPGGIVSGHDYIKFKGKTHTCDVIEATHWYTQIKGVWPWFILGTKAKLPGQTRDRARSWFWVKEEAT